MRRIYSQLNINEKINLKACYDKLGDKFGSKPVDGKAMEMPVVLDETYVWEFSVETPFIK